MKRSAREIDDGIGGSKDRLGRAVVAIERDHVSGGTEMAGKVEDVAHRRGAERIDRLGVVADDGEPAPVWLQRQQDRSLQAVGVLVFVDQHMIEAAADVIGRAPDR